jgi:peptidoglycan/LPS O-acetylase OafA/YrhL
MSLTAAAEQHSKLRVPAIDLLRGLCIVAVVLHHINLRIHFRDSSLGQLIGPAANRALFWNGYYGVRVFFVISGFLITSWSLKRWGRLRQLKVRQFYRMRFARIMPCLAGLLLVLVVLDRLGVPRFIVNTQHTSLARAYNSFSALVRSQQLRGLPHPHARGLANGRPFLLFPLEHSLSAAVVSWHRGSNRSAGTSGSPFLFRAA